MGGPLPVFSILKGDFPPAQQGRGLGVAYGCYLLEHVRCELHGLVVLLLKHVHVQVIQEVVPVIVHPALVQLGAWGGGETHVSTDSFKERTLPWGKIFLGLLPGVSKMQRAQCFAAGHILALENLRPYAMFGEVSSIHDFLCAVRLLHPYQLLSGQQAACVGGSGRSSCASHEK